MQWHLVRESKRQNMLMQPLTSEGLLVKLAALCVIFISSF